MPLETVTYISDLVATNPLGGDSRTEGDDHIRAIKTGLLGSFPNFVGEAVTATEAELNKLDGVTATSTELNYLDISTLGEAQNSKAVTVSAAGVINLLSKSVIGANIDSGTIDGATIGLNSATSGAFTTLQSTGLATLASIKSASGATITEFSIDGTMAGNSNTAAPTEKAVKTYVDGRVEMYREATGVAFGNDSLETFAHGLSGAPDIINVTIKCTDAGGDAGYAQNDVVSLSSGTSNASSGNQGGIGVYADATNVYVQLFAGAVQLYIINKSTGAASTVDETKWEMYCNAIYFGGTTST